MSDDSSKNGLVRVANTSMVRYSNALVRRGIEQLTINNSSPIHGVSDDWKAPLIAVSDDEPTNCYLLASVLEDEGYDTIIVPNKIELLYELPRLKPDAVTTDIKSPDMDGFEFIEAAKADPSTKHIPIIVVSSYADRRNVIEAERLGATDFITQPYDLEDIHASLSRILKLMPYPRLEGTTQRTKRRVLIVAKSLAGESEWDWVRSGHSYPPTITTDGALNVLAWDPVWKKQGWQWRSSLCHSLRLEGYQLGLLDRYEDVQPLCGPKDVVILTNATSGRGAGMAETTITLKSAYPELLVIIVSSYADVQQAIESLRWGASDFISVPFSVDDILESLNRLQENRGNA